jgi:hypothetical protein
VRPAPPGPLDLELDTASGRLDDEHDRGERVLDERVDFGAGLLRDPVDLGGLAEHAEDGRLVVRQAHEHRVRPLL